MGDDSAIVRISKTHAIASTVDFFTPIIDDPFTQGRIAACNSINDVYAKGGLDVISVLVLMGMPQSLPSGIRKRVLRGFHDFCRSERAPVVGGHTIICPWPIIGGTINAIVELKRVILISGAKPGDRLVLTKPLGVQPIMKVLRLPGNEQDRLACTIPDEEISESIDHAIAIMTTSNRNAALAMLDVGANAATDVTGFGIIGHAANMAEQSGVSIRIHTLPVIKGSPAVAKMLGYPLKEGRASETSGGLLISLPRDRTDQLLQALKKRRVEGYEIGVVGEGPSTATLSRDLSVVEVSPGLVPS